jgi:putative transposase
MTTSFADGEYYHIYNRGVDKRNIFNDRKDLERFFVSMNNFNSVVPVGSILEQSTAKNKEEILHNPPPALVQFVCYCLNPNHYHFILKQQQDGGISEFMKRLNGGYTWYFNNRHKLFEGRFKAIHVDSNEYLLYLSAYVNLNAKVHHLGGSTAKVVDMLTQSSWDEYRGKNEKKLCESNIILEQFANLTEYKYFANDALREILKNKEKAKELGKLLCEDIV